MKKKLVISFSGGQTSGFMLKWIIDNWSDLYEIIVVFANTGKENEGTLRFVRDCENNWGIDIVWIESYPREDKTWAVDYKIVDFESASRKGNPFEGMIKKLGVPSTNAPFCSEQLKKFAILKLMRDLGWRKYFIAIGIRADEIDRMNEHHEKNRILYPLVKNIPMSKKMIQAWWDKQNFHLDIPYGTGNCDNYWKKPMKLLVYNQIHYPETFNWWQEMTDKYGYQYYRKSTENMKLPFNFYRGNLSPKDILKLADLSQLQLDMFVENERLDGCSESCEVF